jgi:hypothetical protein
MGTRIEEITAEAIIEEIEESYADIIRIIRNAPVAKIVEPSLSNGWSVKDMIAHVAAWEWRCAFLLEESHVSNAPLQAEPDVEAHNLETLEERKDWGWEEVEDDARAAHRALLRTVRGLPPRRLSDPIVYQAIAVETWKHYNEHLPDLKAWRDSLDKNHHIVLP